MCLVKWNPWHTWWIFLYIEDLNFFVKYVMGSFYSRNHWLLRKALHLIRINLQSTRTLMESLNYLFISPFDVMISVQTHKGISHAVSVVEIWNTDDKFHTDDDDDDGKVTINFHETVIHNATFTRSIFQNFCHNFWY